MRFASFSTAHSIAGSTARKIRGNRGMTLIEVMVAAVILLIAMAGIVPLFVTGLTQASTIRMRSIATNVARQKMELVRQLDYREIYTEQMKESDASLGTRTLESLFGTSETVRDQGFTVTYVVNNQTYQEGTLKEVTVNVGWEAPPRVSPASVTTLVHQQFLGPRGSSLDVTSTTTDPLGSPFKLLAEHSQHHPQVLRGTGRLGADLLRSERGHPHRAQRLHARRHDRRAGPGRALGQCRERLQDRHQRHPLHQGCRRPTVKRLVRIHVRRGHRPRRLLGMPRRLLQRVQRARQHLEDTPARREGRIPTPLPDWWRRLRPTTTRSSSTG